MRYLRIIGALALAMLVASGVRSTQAQGANTGSFTLPAGASATISFTAFCTNFGQKFPTGVQSPNALAPDKIRAALAYIQAQNLYANEQQALEAQYAIWQLAGATGSPAGSDVAKAVVAAANTAPINPQGTSLLDAVKANQVALSLASWAPIGNPVPLTSSGATDHFYGKGTVTVRNTGQQPLTLFMPVGTLFPPSVAGNQTMAGFATDVQVQQVATATRAATVAATATQAAAVAATAAPTATPARVSQLPNTSGGSSGWPITFIIAFLVLLALGRVLRFTITSR